MEKVGLKNRVFLGKCAGRSEKSPRIREIERAVSWEIKIPSKTNPPPRDFLKKLLFDEKRLFVKRDKTGKKVERRNLGTPTRLPFLA
jgi:hypothetical protein